MTPDVRLEGMVLGRHLAILLGEIDHALEVDCHARHDDIAFNLGLTHLLAYVGAERDGHPREHRVDVLVAL